MANNRRLISKEIVRSDAFLSMSLSAQTLYFHLLLEADNRGYINNARSIISTFDDITISDLNELVAKNFLLDRGAGLYLIKHWYIHNDLPKGYVEESNYLDDLVNIYFNSNMSYTTKVTEKPVLETIKVKKPFKENKIKETKVNENKVNENNKEIISNKENSDREFTEEEIEILKTPLWKDEPNDDDKPF